MLDTNWDGRDSNPCPLGEKETLITTPNKFFYHNMICIILIIIINVGDVKHARAAADASRRICMGRGRRKLNLKKKKIKSTSASVLRRMIFCVNFASF